MHSTINIYMRVCQQYAVTTYNIINCLLYAMMMIYVYNKYLYNNNSSEVAIAQF